MTGLRTERLWLRPARPDDLAAVHAILGDDRAMTYWSSLPHSDLEQSREWLDLTIANRPEDGEDFIVEHAGRVIGKVGFYRFPEIGYIFHPDHWGQGFAREALSAVLDRGFAHHKLPVARADVDPRNIASLRLLERLGFRETARAERTWLIGDQWCDSVYLALEAERWSAEMVP